jgi:hypothetical protein
MGLFSNLMQKIFRAGAVAEAPPDAWKAGDSGESRLQQADRLGVPVSSIPMGSAVPAPTAAATAAPAAPAAAAISEVDVTSILDGMAAKNSEKLDWKKSIVDLMKLVGMDSSLSERKELARELGYTGDMNDSAKMNMWLHKEVMKKLAENGGKVPANLLD